MSAVEYLRNLSLSLLVLATGCGGTEARGNLPPVVKETARVEYRSQTNLADCPDAPSRVQARIEQLESMLHVQGPQRIVYSRFVNERGADAVCASGSYGCASGASVFSTDHAMFHEIVHATMSASSPNTLIEEGLAVAFGYQGDQAWRGWADPWPNWSDLIAVDPLKDPRVYSYGGAFVTYLISTYGADSFVTLYRLSQRGEGASEFAQRFFEVYSMSLDAAWSAAAAGTQSTSLCMDLQPNMNTDGSEAGAPGDHCVGSYLYGRHAFVLGKSTPLAVETGYSQVTFGSCDLAVVTPVTLSGTWLENSASIANSLVLHLAPWQAGTYYATAYVLKDNETFRVRSGPWIGGACDSVSPYQLDRPVNEIILLMRGEIDSWTAINWTGTSPIVLNTVLLTQTPYEWSICKSCGEATCEPVSVSPPRKPLALSPGVTWIHAVRPAGNTATTDFIIAH